MTAPPLRVAVIGGGPSTEAEVSRVSAGAVAEALLEAGHAALRFELDAGLGAALLAQPLDVVFPVGHGRLGEDGSVQGLLEVLRLPYVGSDVLASAVAFDKLVAKTLFLREGLPVALDAVGRRGAGGPSAAARVRKELGPAVVVKPRAQGSAIGVTRVPAEASDADLARAIDQALAIDDAALCERFVVGREVTCGVLDASALGPPFALPPTEIFAKLAGWYDFRSRYAKGGSEHRCPADLAPLVAGRLQEVALAAHRALGCRDLSRVDFVVGDGADGDAVTLLEVNTMPGMTPTSLFPEAAGVAGVPMRDLCDGLVRTAFARGVRPAPVALPMP